jgi:4-hydroxy-tetrahydrodipicolinate synthase
MFQGAYTAIITPFRNGKVDEKKLEELVTFQVEAGIQGIVACGTTGESLYLSSAEKKRIIEICARICKDKARVIAGTGALSVDETITQTREAQKAGATEALIITPWYIKPSQESLYHYYKKVSENVDLPIALYNNPTRTGVEMSVETVLKLAALKNIHGIKDASPTLQRVSEIKQSLGDRFNLLAGNDDTLAAYLALGGDGGICVASNVAPSLFVTLLKAWKENDLVTFKALWEKIYPLASILSLARIKYAMALVYGVSIDSRLPFAPLNATEQEIVEKALQSLGLWEPLARVRER